MRGSAREPRLFLAVAYALNGFLAGSLCAFLGLPNTYSRDFYEKGCVFPVSWGGRKYGVLSLMGTFCALFPGYIGNFANTILTGLKELFSTPNVRLEPGLEISLDVAIRIKNGDREE